MIRLGLDKHVGMGPIEKCLKLLAVCRAQGVDPDEISLPGHLWTHVMMQSDAPCLRWSRAETKLEICQAAEWARITVSRDGFIGAWRDGERVAVVEDWQ